MEEIPEIYVDHLKRQGFELGSLIGSGSTGRVVSAFQGQLERLVAVKFCDSTYAQRDPKLRLRFIREGRLLAKCRHPNIPFVITRGEVDGTPYMVMEFIDGESLEERIRRDGVIPLADALHIASQYVGALACAHENKVFHRDVKPANILVSREGRCTLLDFSIGGETAKRTQVTQTGDRLGTANYAAPEQFAGEDVLNDGPPVDVYAAAVVLFEMLTGHIPPASPTSTDLVQSLLSSYELEVQTLICCALSHDPKSRFKDCGEMFTAISPLLTRSDVLAKTVALCVSVNKCMTYDTWNNFGWSPLILPPTEKKHCSDCGEALVRQCRKCKRALDEEPGQFCGNCGTALWIPPTCARCDAVLFPREIGSDTAESGCHECQDSSGASDFDDIPF